MRYLSLLLIALLASTLVGCGPRTLRIDYIPVEEELTPQVVEKDPGAFVTDKIAMVNVSGLIANMNNGSLLSSGTNPVSDFRETLNAIERDPSVKAVILRMNTPGGTVTASDMMYRDLVAFKARTHKPVVVAMTDVCASGGYYLSCAGDYRIAYPSTITGSIGVIIETFNFSGTLGKLGISAKAITSRENKDMGSPFRPMTENDEKLLKALVDQFYAQFLGIVKASHQRVADADWSMVTDGRVFTGKDAQRLGLIDQLGSLDDAIIKAKQMSGIKLAKIIMYTHQEGYKGSTYAKAPSPTHDINMLNVNVDTAGMLPSTHPEFLYLWKGS
jgi:protease IV